MIHITTFKVCLDIPQLYFCLSLLISICILPILKTCRWVPFNLTRFYFTNRHKSVKVDKVETTYLILLQWKLTSKLTNSILASHFISRHVLYLFVSTPLYLKCNLIPPGGPLKCNVVSRCDQGFLKYTLNKYFLLKPKYTLNADFTRFLTNFTP